MRFTLSPLRVIPFEDPFETALLLYFLTSSKSLESIEYVIVIPFYLTTKKVGARMGTYPLSTLSCSLFHLWFSGLSRVEQKEPDKFRRL